MTREALAQQGVAAPAWVSLALSWLAFRDVLGVKPGGTVRQLPEYLFQADDMLECCG